jgi:hypothetical protein
VYTRAEREYPPIVRLARPGDELPSVPTGTLDIGWISIVPSMDLVLISRDKRIRSKPAELDAFRACGLQVFWSAGKRDMTNWENLVLMVKWWGRLEEIIRDRGPGPWFYAISDGVVREIAV